MHLRKVFVGGLIGVGVGLMMTAPVCAQSVGIGNSLIDVLDAEGDTMFNVGSGNDVNIGGTGADVDLFAWSSGGVRSLFFNSSGGDMNLGGGGMSGHLLIYDAGGAYTFWANGGTGSLILGGGIDDGELFLRNNNGIDSIVADGGTGDLTLGGGAVDGDIILKDATTGLTNFSADGSLGHLTLGSNGSAGDYGALFLRDTNGTTNTVTVFGHTADVFLGSGTTGDSGDILLHDGSSTWGAYIYGSSGNFHNKGTGNGIVKAWARINSTGTISSCFRCITSATETRRTGLGQYEVDFSSGYFDTSTRPVLCTPGHSGAVTYTAWEISCTQRSSDSSSIFVITRNSAGAIVDSNFTIVVF